MAEEEVRRGNRGFQRGRRPIRLWKVSIVVLALLIIIGSSFIGYNKIQDSYKISTQQIATAQAQESERATHTAQIQAQAQATTSALAQLQADYELITSTRPTMNDLMHSSSPHNWDTGTGCSFKHSSYSITITQKASFIPCIAKGTKFSNFAYQVRMKIVQGDAGGIIFRANATNSQAYLFNIGQDGSYSMYYYPGDATKTTRMISSGFSNLIATGEDQENLLAVIARKNRLDLYINKKYLTSFQDSNLTAGQIGIIANDNLSNTEVVCTQAQVWKL